MAETSSVSQDLDVHSGHLVGKCNTRRCEDAWGSGQPASPATGRGANRMEPAYQLAQLPSSGSYFGQGSMRQHLPQ